MKSGCSEGHTTFASRDFNCLEWGEEWRRELMKCVWNEGYL
jgi:hypothetical protein